MLQRLNNKTPIPGLVSSTRSVLLAMAMAVAACSSSPSRTSSEQTSAGIQISQTERGAMVTTEDMLLFDTGKSNVKAEASRFIDRLVELAKRNDSRILIEGHTDNVGGTSFNLRLSEERAKSVKEAMIGGGISSEKITVVGLGQGQPVAPNDTEPGRAKNRRTEIILLGETVEDVERQGFFSGIGRSISVAMNQVSAQLEPSPTAASFDPSRRIQARGSVTHCGNRANARYVVIDASAVQPSRIKAGQQAILTINVQLCIPSEVATELSQTIRIMQAGAVVAEGGVQRFPGLQRYRYSLHSRITALGTMAPGIYEVESAVNLDGKIHRQTTPLVVQ